MTMWNASMVEWLDIEVTSYCGLKCPGCLRQQGEWIQPHLNSERLELDLLKERITRKSLPNLKTINFCGSIDEPMAHPDIQKISEWVTDLGCHLNIATSGSVRNPKFWSRYGSFLHSHPHSVFFGIDGMGNTSERYRIGSDWELVRNNSRAFIQSGGKAIWQYIAFEWNSHQIEDAKRESSREGFSGFRLIWSHRDRSGEMRKGGDDKGESNSVSGPPQESSPSVLATSIPTRPHVSCRYLQSRRLFLNHKGYVIPCCHLNSDTLKLIYGREGNDDKYRLFWETEGKESINIHHNNFENILDSDYYHGIIESWTDEPFDRCVSTCAHKNHDEFEDDKYV